MAADTPKVAVVMTTYAPLGEVGEQRQKYAWQTIESLRVHLRGANFRMHIADDGSAEQEFVKNLAGITCAYQGWQRAASFTNAMRSGIGGSLNLALARLHEDIWMYMTDDWLLTDALDISRAVDLIVRRGYDYVRLGPIHPHLQCSTEFDQEIGWWLRIHQKWGGFCFATRPFLASKAFYKRVGDFKSKCDSYECEKDYNERVCAIEELKLASIEIHGPWKHVGDNYSIGLFNTDFSGVGAA